MTKQLDRIQITRRSDDRWDVLRQRKESGEMCTGCRTLEEAFDYIRAAYDESGEEKKAEVEEGSDE